MSSRPFSSPLARPTDPETSAAAADRAESEGRIDTDEWQILTVLREMPQGGTGSEIAAKIRSRFHRPMTNVPVMRRMAELLGNGQAHRRRDPRTGKHLRRGGEALHWFGRGDCPLCPDW